MVETDGDTDDVPPRPRKNPELIGHGAAETTLLDAWNSGRVAHAWMLCGPKGIGKATLAYRFARFALAGGGGGGLFGDGPDGLAMDPDDPVFRRVAAGGHGDMMAVTISFDDKRKRWREEIVVDDVRALGPFMRLTASEGGWRVAVVDSADLMNINAANALLKVLEEPPDKALLLLVSHSPGRLLPTIRSRCRRLTMQALDEAQVAAFLDRFRPALEDDEVMALARLAEGSPGRALRLADAGGLALYGEMIEMLSAVDGLDVAALHGLADRMARVNARDAFATLMELLGQWLVAMVRAGASGTAPKEIVAGEGAVVERLLGRASLEQWTEVWEKIGRLAADVERINLDRKQVVISAFNALEATARN